MPRVDGFRDGRFQNPPPPMNIRNTFDDAGSLTSVLPREGIDIGPVPDFWGDFDEMLKRMPVQRQAPAPRLSAGTQSSALRMPPPGEGRRSSARPTQGSSPPRTPIFRKVIGGAQIVPGYMEADQGDPNAAFAGWRL